MDVKYINPLLSGTRNVFMTMAQIDLTPGKPYLKKDREAQGDISAILGLTGEVEGSLSVSCTQQLICQAVTNMLGELFQEIDDDVKDAMGELANMISGDARRILSENGLTIKGGIPTIISGTNHGVRHFTSGPVIAIPFECAFGHLTVEVAFSA
ncbi:MAG: chemotaxis protein CheX [Proteobacteria bacterium]|nr:chemotaxis protein CheX [Pseudomonadota bacterium]